ncbi:hypothetical protein EC991_007438 [Linnemannia zychae]|nr:hypothetical protein EC991_007438 [Linnemannia zychae]
MNSSSPNQIPHTSNNNTNNSTNKNLQNNNSNRTPFQLTQPVSVESIVAALRELPCSTLLLALTQSKSAPPIMANEIHSPGSGVYDSGWPTNDDAIRNHENNLWGYPPSRDALDNRVDETDNTAATNGWHQRTDAQHPTATDTTVSWSYTNSSRFNNHDKQMPQYHYHQQQQPLPPPQAPRTVQYDPTNRHPSISQTQFPAEPHTKYESNRAHSDQPVSPAPIYPKEDIPRGQKNYNGYENEYSTTTNVGSRPDPWFNGEYKGDNKGDDSYIPEDIRPPCFETSRSPSGQYESGPRHNLTAPAFDLLSNPVVHGPDACVIEERGIITFIEQHDEGLILEPRSLMEEGPDDPLLMVHTRRYLDSVTVNDPLIHFRLVMPAGQLPRGDAFARTSGNLRARHLIDTFLIPHETTHIPSHHDVVLGLSGTLDRVCRALEDLLQRLVHGTEGLVLWRLCFLIPFDIIHLVVDGRREQSTSNPRVKFCRCSLPRLKNAMGRVYDPISKTDECVLSLQSSSLDAMLAAARCLGEVLAQEEDTHLLCEEFYTGGWPTIIPAERKLPKELIHTTTNLDRLTPLGYILRPEMRDCLQILRVNRYHIQLLMFSSHTLQLAGEGGDFVRRQCEGRGAFIAFSEEIIIGYDPFRFCDIGSNSSEAIEFALAEIIWWLYELGYEGWVMKVIIPERIAGSWRSPDAAGRTRRGFHHSVTPLSEVYKSWAHTDSFELEPSEQESVLSIRSQTKRMGLQEAIRAIHSEIYLPDI